MNNEQMHENYCETTYENTYVFNNVNQAISWSTEVLRRRRFPKLSSMYAEIKNEHFEEEEMDYIECNLPKNVDDRLSLAMKVYSLLTHYFSSDDQAMAQLFYWGDYASDYRLHRAKEVQNKARKEGKRVRLSWNYSYRQLGAALCIDHKTAKRRMDKVHEKMTALLHENHLLVQAYDQVA